MISRMRVLYLVMALFALCLFISCEPDDDHAPVVSEAYGDTAQNPDSYVFTLSIPSANPLSVNISRVSDNFTATMGTVEAVTGSYVYSSNTWTLDMFSTWNTVTVKTNEEPSRSFNISITKAVSAVGSGYPTQGALSILGDWGVITAAFSDAGVTIRRGSDIEKTCSWNGLQDLLDSDTADDWEKQASLACSVIRLLMNESAYALDTAAAINQNRDTISESSPLSIDGDEFTGTPPLNLPKQGRSILSMTDRHGDSRAGTGDNFSWTCIYPWDKDAGTITLGMAYMINYTRTVSSVGGTEVITRTGFTADSGGMVYSNLVRSKVVEALAGIFEIDDDSTLTLNGGLSILFTM